MGEETSRIVARINAMNMETRRRIAERQQYGLASDLQTLERRRIAVRFATKKSFCPGDSFIPGAKEVGYGR